MFSKAIKIIRHTDRSYSMEIKGVPLVCDGKGANFDRIKAGVKTGKGWTAPAEGAPSYRFNSKRAAEGTAHSIGRYILGLGDLVFSYVDHVDARAVKTSTPAPTVGYLDCACRDCFEIAIGPIGTLCSDCKGAGCDAFYTECRAPRADGAEESNPA